MPLVSMLGCIAEFSKRKNGQRIVLYSLTGQNA
jgi:hypothetical protein